MAINSASPPNAAALLTAKVAPGAATSGKLPATAPGTPAWPPEGITALTRGAAPATPPAAGPAAAPTPATADPRALQPKVTLAQPGTIATPASTPTVTPAQDAKPTTSSPRTRLKGTTVPQTADPALAAQLQPVLGAALAGGGTQASATITTAPDAPDAAASGGDPLKAAALGVELARPPLPQAQVTSPATAASGPEDEADAPAADASSGPLFATIATALGASANGAKATASLDAGGQDSPSQDSGGGAGADTAGTSSAAPADLSAVLSDPASARSDAAAAATAAGPSLPVHSPVGTSGWADQIGTHVVWMAHQGVSSASLRLEPEHLGPVEVKISVHDDSASVWFGASAAETRAALQQALPQLREMFSAQGMTLTDAGVSGQSARDTQHGQRSATAAGAGSAAPGAENATSVSVSVTRRGLVDAYA